MSPYDVPLMTAATSGAFESDRRFEHYEILTRPDGSLFELGRGTMGVTYKARDSRLHCFVALKVISAALLAKHPTARERFLREARAAAQLRHPNVASVFHLGERADGQCFYAMEFIEGETLSERVARRGPLPVGLALEIIAQVTRALIAASQQGLVHRDLKPANLMFVTGESGGCDPSLGGTAGEDSATGDEVLVKVIDFGLAKAVTGGTELTAFGNFLGTPHFASPEQFSGAGSGEPLDTRSDMFSLGVTLWFLLSGSLPFPGRSLGEIHSQQHRGELPFAQLKATRVPVSVTVLLESMLAVNPADRPQTPYALAEALRRCRGSLDAFLAGDTQTVAAAPVTALLRENRRRRREQRRNLALLGVGAALAVALLLVAGWFGLLQRSGPPEVSPDVDPALSAEPISDKSLAVLPFENLSDDKENAFFADGIQDDLLTSLARISELRVISRTSVLAYRRGQQQHPPDGSGGASFAPRPGLREIGRALGVAHILEGSVRRAGRRVRVSVQLVDARADRQLWAETFDRDLTDVLSLQSELAREIATTLRATLSPQEKAGLERPPTASSDAYVLFLKAREFQTRFVDRPLSGRDLWHNAERLYEQAITLDPTFAVAYARLSETRSKIYWWYEPTAERKAKARAAVDEALRLQPDLGEGHLALGLWLYWAERDYDQALEEFTRARRLLPNESDVTRYTAAMARRRGHWREAIAEYQRANALSPRDPAILWALASTHEALRDYPAAAHCFDRALALGPDSVGLKLGRAFLEFEWKGRIEPLTEVLASFPAGMDPGGVVTLARVEAALLARDFDAAERALAASPLETFPVEFGAPQPKSFLLGRVALLRGDVARARALFEQARPTYEAAVRKTPLDPFRIADLGGLYAGLGWKEAAEREATRALGLMPASIDAIDSAGVMARAARIHARLRDADGALPLLARLLVVPAFERGVTVHDLRLHPEWDPLRDDPRFQKLIADGLDAPLPLPAAR